MSSPVEEVSAGEVKYDLEAQGTLDSSIPWVGGDGGSRRRSQAGVTEMVRLPVETIPSSSSSSSSAVADAEEEKEDEGQRRRERRVSTLITPLPELLAKRIPESKLAQIQNPGVREYYTHMNELLDGFEEMHRMLDPLVTSGKGGKELTLEGRRQERRVQYLVDLSFILNILLVIAKIIAAVMSGSLTVIASALDSALDIVSAMILWWTRRSMINYNPYKYPQGRNRLEPAGVMIFAVIMGMGSLQLIIQSSQVLAAGLADEEDRPSLNVDGVTIGVMVAVIGVKLFLWIASRSVASHGNYPSLTALADDHRNDVVTNSFGIAAVVIANEITKLWFLDPAGAILLALLIILAWIQTAKEQLRFIVGGSASHLLLSKLIYLAAISDVRIRRVDTLIAYHFGVNFLVQCDIVLPEDMPLRDAHDIGDDLERRMERLEEVDRCFVHLDWEWEHSPEHHLPFRS